MAGCCRRLLGGYALADCGLREAVIELSHPVRTVPAMPALTDLDRQILTLKAGGGSSEGERHRDPGTVDVSPTVRAQRVNALLDRPEALAAEPQTVARLRRLREQRQGRRQR